MSLEASIRMHSIPTGKAKGQRDGLSIGELWQPLDLGQGSKHLQEAASSVRVTVQELQKQD